MKLKIKYLIFPVIFFTLAVLHMIFPTITIDGATITLIILGLIPWISLIIKEISLPGGIKITFNDLKKPSEKLIEESKQENIEPKEESIKSVKDEGIQEILSKNPALSLVYVRAEIEKRLIELAKRENLSYKGKSTKNLIQDLRRNKTISTGIYGSLYELIDLGNKAAHGEKVSDDVIIWAYEYAPQIFSILDQMITHSTTTL